jgi:hypothetical protein
MWQRPAEGGKREWLRKKKFLVTKYPFLRKKWQGFTIIPDDDICFFFFFFLASLLLLDSFPFPFLWVPNACFPSCFIELTYICFVAHPFYCRFSRRVLGICRIGGKWGDGVRSTWQKKTGLISLVDHRSDWNPKGNKKKRVLMMVFIWYGILSWSIFCPLSYCL